MHHDTGCRSGHVGTVPDPSLTERKLVCDPLPGVGARLRALKGRGESMRKHYPSDLRAMWRTVDQSIVIPEDLLHYASGETIAAYRDGFIAGVDVLVEIGTRIGLYPDPETSMDETAHYRCEG